MQQKISRVEPNNTVATIRFCPKRHLVRCRQNRKDESAATGIRKRSPNKSALRDREA